MPRGLDVATLAEIQKDAVYLVQFIEFYFDSVIRLTTADFDISIDLGDGTQTYVSSPSLVSIGDVSESLSLEVSSMKYTLSAVAQANIATVLSEVAVNKVVKQYRGFLNPDTYAVIGVPELIYSGRITSFQINETPGATAALTCNTASILADFKNSTGRRTNHQDQVVYLANFWAAAGATTYEHPTTPTHLEDSTARFARSPGVYAGVGITNVTDGSVGTVASITSDSVIVTSTLTGGIDNSWDLGDIYRITPPVDKGFEYAHQINHDIKWGRG